jgi:hypothetical protein
MPNESQVKAEIRKHFGTRPDVKLFNNPVGQGWVSNEVSHPAPGITVLRNARLVDFGLMPGSADLIGCHIESGKAIFLTPEVKPSRIMKATAQQQNWIQQVRLWGGKAGVVRSIQDMEDLLAGRDYPGMDK